MEGRGRQRERAASEFLGESRFYIVITVRGNMTGFKYVNWLFKNSGTRQHFIL